MAALFLLDDSDHLARKVLNNLSTFRTDGPVGFGTRLLCHLDDYPCGTLETLMFDLKLIHCY